MTANALASIAANRYVVAMRQRRENADSVAVGTAPLALSLASVALMAAASAAGVFLPDVYARETASWAAQGIGQDAVNLLVTVPALLVAAYLAARGSIAGRLVWLGLLLYVIYSYVLYAFFVHFNWLFPIYVAALGCAFWAAVGCVSGSTIERLGARLDRGRPDRLPAAYLMASALLFAALWLSDIVRAIAAGAVPRDVIDVGLPVNPVHVLDLAFVLPAMAATSVSLWKRRPAGLFFATPLMTFAAAMGIAIAGMSIAMRRHGVLSEADDVIVLCAGLVAAPLALTAAFLRRLRAGAARTPAIGKGDPL